MNACSALEAGINCSVSHVSVNKNKSDKSSSFYTEHLMMYLNTTAHISHYDSILCWNVHQIIYVLLTGKKLRG